MMSVGVTMTERKSAEQDSLIAYLDANPDQRGVIHEIAMGLYNQIRYFGIERSKDCRRMVENALLLAQVNFGTISMQEEDSLSAIQKRASAPHPRRGDAPATVQTMEYFMEHSLRYASAGIQAVASEAAKVALSNPECGVGFEHLVDQATGHSPTLKQVFASNPLAQEQVRLEAITDSLRSYAIIEVGEQLDRLFNGHEALMSRIANAKTNDLRPR